MIAREDYISDVQELIRIMQDSKAPGLEPLIAEQQAVLEKLIMGGNPADIATPLSDAMRQHAANAASKASESAGGALATFTEVASEHTEKAGGFFSNIGQRFGEVAGTVKTKAGEFAEQTKERLSPMMDNAKEKMTAATENLKERWGDLDPNMQKVVLVGGAVCATVGGLCAGKAVADRIQGNHQAASQQAITMAEIQQLREQNGAGRFEQMLAAREGRSMGAAPAL